MASFSTPSTCQLIHANDESRLLSASFPTHFLTNKVQDIAKTVLRSCYMQPVRCTKTYKDCVKGSEWHSLLDGDGIYSSLKGAGHYEPVLFKELLISGWSIIQNLTWAVHSDGCM